MEIVNDIRFWIGVVALATWLPAIFSWLIIHPFINVWRKTGQGLMWVVVAFFGLSGVYLLFHYREVLMGGDLGFSYWTLVPGAVFVMIGFYLDYERRKTLTTRILVGAPEVEGDASNLLTTGPYARVRHPRYLAILFSYFGFALLANYLGLYIYMALSLPVLWLIILLEERELKARFGKAYADYAAKTPRLIPKF